MSKILLVNPPFYRLLQSHYNANSLGIAYIASYLNSKGHDGHFEFSSSYLKDGELQNTPEYGASYLNELFMDLVFKISDWKDGSYTLNKEGNIITSDLTSLFYYHNRMDGYDLEKLI